LIEKCREMIEVMGGREGKAYTHFKSLCFTAFIILRRNNTSLLNLISTIVPFPFLPSWFKAACGFGDFKGLGRDVAVKRVSEKFRQEVGEKDAVRMFDGLIDESVDALFPIVMERIHRFAQYWRG
jgi:phosphatidylinositol 3-kinase